MPTAGRTAKLGDDLTVSALGFGAGALAVYGDADDSESIATLNRCLDLGGCRPTSLTCTTCTGAT